MSPRRPKNPTRESVQAKVNRLEDKVDARMDRVENKIDSVGFALNDMTAVLTRNTVTLEDHVKRTNLLEAAQKNDKEGTDKRLEHLEAAHSALMSVPEKIGKIAKWASAGTALISLIGGIAHIAIKLIFG